LGHYQKFLPSEIVCLYFEAIDHFVIVGENHGKWLEKITSVNTINVENLLKVVRAEIIFFDVLDTSLIGDLEKVLDEFIELGIFRVSNSRE
jgi:hypothetical protein